MKLVYFYLIEAIVKFTMAQASLPLSELLKTKDADDDALGKLKSRDDWKKEKELEEARKVSL